MPIKNRPFFPKIKLALIISAALIFIIPVLIIGLTVLHKTWKHMRLSDICPDYASEQYAWIVDESGKGIDSVSVVLKDNANFNLVYRTFTDSTGRFVLFNDFGSFALHNLPFSYELQVSFKDYKDTIMYKFKRYRFCHFSKTDGPDTIVFELLSENKKTIIAEYGKKVAVEDVFEHAPFQKIALSKTAPFGLKNLHKQYRDVKYGSIDIGREMVLFAVADKYLEDSISGGNENGKIGLIIDRDFDKDLNNDQIKTWDLLYNNNESNFIDCDIRKCFLRDTLVHIKENIVIDFQLEGFGQQNTFFYYRRGDVLKAVIPVAGKRMKVVLWDRLLTRFSDLKYVQIGIDRNSDGRFSSDAGDAELMETALWGISVDSLHYEIDSISMDGSALFYSQVLKDTILAEGASIGDWAGDFNSFYAQPLSLYNEISMHPLVLLCFFEGNTQQALETSEMGAILRILTRRIKNICIIGVNRKTSGPHYAAFPVIEENMGWNGRIVKKFHNNLESEVICIDSTATIIARGAPDKVFLESLWKKLNRKDLAVVFSELRSITE